MFERLAALTQLCLEMVFHVQFILILKKMFDRLATSTNKRTWPVKSNQMHPLNVEISAIMRKNRSVDSLHFVLCFVKLLPPKFDHLPRALHKQRHN